MKHSFWCWMLAFVMLPTTLAHPLSKKADRFGDKFDHVILEDITTVQVQDSGMNYRTERRAIKVLSHRGCQAFHSIHFFYDPLTMNMTVSEASIEKPDGHMTKIDLSEVKSYPMPARAIYWPNIRISIPYGLLEPGDIVSYTLEKKGFSYALLDDESIDDDRFAPPMKGHFYDIVSFQEMTPILHKSYSVELPADKPIQYHFYHGEVQPKNEFTEFGMKYTFIKNDIEAISREPNMVDISDFGAKLLISTTRKWEDKSEWFFSVNENFSFEVSPDIQNKVDELIANCQNDEERIDVLNHWVAHYIRYSGLSMGEGEGFTLHPSDMIMRDRSGVCKDKASLLITFLRAAGFEAFPAMTMAGSRIEDFPADHFNHCVVALRQDDGTFRMLDPTWVPWVREQWSSAEQEQQYLIGYKEGQTLMTTPYSPPEKHYYKLTSKSLLREDGTLASQFYLELEGQVDSRLRRSIQRHHKQESDAYFIGILKELWCGVKIKKLTYQDPWDIGKNMVVEIEFEVPNFGVQSTQQAAIKSPGLIFLMHDRINRDLTTKFQSDTRKTDIRTRCTKQVRLEETITFPKSWNNRQFEGLMNQTEKGEYANLTFNSSLNKNTVSNQLLLNLNRRIYPAEAYDNLRRVLNGIQHLSDSFMAMKEKGGAK